MGEWSPDDVPYESFGEGDTAPTGAGGDPYAGDDAYPAVESSDTESLGTLPGGSDGSFTPFSPNQGFDYSDILRGAGAVATQVGFLQTAKNASRKLADRYLNAFPDSAYGPLLPLKRMLSPGGGGGGVKVIANPGLPDAGMGGSSPARQAQAILHQVRVQTGMRVTQRSLVRLAIRYGFGPTQAMTGLQPAQLLFLFMREKGTTHHRRGPGLYTIARKFRRHAALQRQVSHILGRGGARRARHHRKHYAFHKRRKR